MKKPLVEGGFFSTRLQCITKVGLLIFASVNLISCVSNFSKKNLVGLKRERLVEFLGHPDLEYEVGGVKKLQFVKGPYGSETYFVKIDTDGVVTDVEQVLNEKTFSLLRKGMTKAEVIDVIGPTKIKHKIARYNAELWHYRYETTECKSFVIEFSSFGLVENLGYRYRGGRQCKYVGP